MQCTSLLLTQELDRTMVPHSNCVLIESFFFSSALQVCRISPANQRVCLYILGVTRCSFVR